MATPVQANQFYTSVGVQSAQGTPAAAVKRKLRQVSGSLGILGDTFSEDYGDGKRFSSPVTGKSTIFGGGSPQFQAVPLDLVAFLEWILGSASVSAADVNGIYTHTINESNSAPFLTFWRSVGAGGGETILRLADAKMSSLVVEASRTNLVAKVTPTIVGLSPTKQDSIGAAALASLADPFELSHMEGTFTAGAVALAAGQVSNFALTITDNVEPYYGESARSKFLTPGRARITVALTLLLTDEGQALWNKIHYGSATPSAGDAPTTDRYEGNLVCKFTRGTGATLEEVAFSIPGVQYMTTDALEGQADGGAIELAVSGEAILASGQTNIISVTGKSAGADWSASFLT